VIQVRYFLILSFLLCQPPLLAADGGVTQLPASVQSDTLTITVPLGAFVSEEDSSSIVGGETLSIICRLELWQKRRLWFDRLRMELAGYAEVTYDRWGERFTASGFKADGSHFDLESSQLDSLMTQVAESLPFPFALQPSDYSRESYVACAVELQYLTPDRLADLKDWLFSGKGSKPTGSGDRGRSFPSKLINMALNSTGFRNRSYLESSASFFPGQIEGAINFSEPLN